ncbi:MAG: hypothetical protein VB082_02085 [Christensenella sp.]|nr:hypothetical protein [Christensenella sp.]
MSEKNPLFIATEKVGQSAEDAAVAWCQAATTLDFLSWETMEEALGARQAHIIYSRIWEKMAQNELDGVLRSLGMQDKTDFSMKDIAEICKVYWNGISCPYEVVELTDDVHIGEISDCPYWENMKILYGEDRARDMVKKGMGATTANYYQAIIKALGKWDEIYATQDRCICLGDDKCRLVFRRRDPKFKGMTENL